MYGTHFPYVQYSQQINQTGMKPVYYAEDYRNHPYAVELFKEAGVKVKKVKLTHVALDMKAHEKAAYVKRLLAELKSHTRDNTYYDNFKKEAEALFNINL